MLVQAVIHQPSISERSIFMSNVKSTESVTFIKVSDLLKVIDQLYIDQMDYARLTIRYDDESDILDGSVHISGIPAFDSPEPSKHYKFIPAANLPHCYL